MAFPAWTTIWAAELWGKRSIKRASDSDGSPLSESSVIHRVPAGLSTVALAEIRAEADLFSADQTRFDWLFTSPVRKQITQEQSSRVAFKSLPDADRLVLHQDTEKGNSVKTTLGESQG